MSLRRIFAWYTVGFLGITILIGLAQALFGLPNRWVGWLFMGLSLAIYVVIGIITRTSNADQYYVAGRGVPAIYNGMATGSDWMSAASFISMGGALSAQGFAGLAYVMGGRAATCSSPSSSAPTSDSSAPTRSPIFSAPVTAATRPG
jgi:cation/acetate symporter